MASPRINVGTQRRAHFLKRRDQEKHSRSSKKERLQEVQRSARISQLQTDEHKMVAQVSPSSQVDQILEQTVSSQSSQPLPSSSKLHPKSKTTRGKEYRAPSHEGPPTKRPKLSPSNQPAKEQKKQDDFKENNLAAMETWIKTQNWPPEYFKPDSQAGSNFFEVDSRLEEEPMEQPPTPVVQYVEINGFRCPRPVPKIQYSVRRKRSSSSLTESSDEEDDKIIISKYRHKYYPLLLEAKGSYMTESRLDISDASKAWCITLIDSKQTVPENSLFRDDIFHRTCGKLQNRNEARVTQDVARLIVPSAETLATYGAKHLDHLIENINDVWSQCIPFEGPKPKPSYSIGFTRSSFTKQQFSKLNPFIGSLWDTSFFAATSRLFFPFLTCESKSGVATFEIANRQNAHSMTVAVKAVVELYRLVKREQELHREILGFSVSHDTTMVEIFGHYAIIDGKETTFFTHFIDAFGIQARNGREKWTAYKFTKNVYDLWMPMHLKRLCSAIDELPLGVDFKVSRSVLQFSDTSELSRESNGRSTDQSNVGSTSEAGQDDSETVPVALHTETPETSDIQPSQGKEEAALKRPKRKHTAK